MPYFTLVGFGSFSGSKEAGGFGLKGVAAATPSIGFSFAVFGFFAKLLFTAEFFGSGLSRDRPITAFLSLSHKPSRIASHS